MAAPDGNKTSPSNRDVQTSQEESKVAAIEAPSYTTSMQSPKYQVAKALLNDGDFEQALSTLEEALEETRAHLVSLNEDEELHSAMAPFFYLYGTTLLYSIEESTDPQQAMTAGNAEGEDDADADDMQIAFENLDTARIIMEKFPADEQALDLAQVYLREGDLHRWNGRYLEAIADYKACLKIRTTKLGPFDRKIADVHYNLALAYSLVAAEGETAEGEAHLKTEDLRGNSIHHFLACARAISGQISFLCHQDGVAFVDQAEKAIASLKSTGEDEDDQVEQTKVASQKLQSLHKAVADLAIPAETQQEVAVLRELLEEIQESVDEAENSEKGVKEVSSMKEAISAAVAAQAVEESAFDVPSGNFAADASAPTSAAAAQPMMVVKKKKRASEAHLKHPPSKEPKSE